MANLYQPDLCWWTLDDGVTWDFASMDADKIFIGDGISISFGSSTGHVDGDYWTHVIPNHTFNAGTGVDMEYFSGDGVNDAQVQGVYHGLDYPVTLKVYAGVRRPERFFQDMFYAMLPEHMVTLDSQFSDSLSWCVGTGGWSLPESVQAGTFTLAEGLGFSWLDTHKHTCGDQWTITINGSREYVVTFRGYGSYGVNGIQVVEVAEGVLPEAYVGGAAVYKIRIVASTPLWGFSELVGYTLDLMREKQQDFDVLTTAFKDAGFLAAWAETLGMPELADYLSVSHQRNLFPWLLRLLKVKGTPGIVQLISRLLYGKMLSDEDVVNIRAAVDGYSFTARFLDLSTQLGYGVDVADTDFLQWKSENAKFVLERFLPIYVILLVGLTIDLDLTVDEALAPLYDTDTMVLLPIVTPFKVSGNGVYATRSLLGKSLLQVLEVTAE